MRRKTTMTPEPTDKLDTARISVGVVNGPEGVILEWHAVDWRAVESNVRRLRQRIFTASRAGDLARVRCRQKLMLRSRSNTLISVRRVTERNAGRLTASVDGEVVLTAEAKLTLANADPWVSELIAAFTKLKTLPAAARLTASPPRRSSRPRAFCVARHFALHGSTLKNARHSRR
ncbi:MAG: reverse transcriptase N-terminal domain-containing protein [Solirubrobacteraceae bacterium]